MSLLIYEMKKMFYHQKGLLWIGLFFIFSIMTLIIFDKPENPGIEMHFEEYSYYLNQVDGPYSVETEEFLTAESKRISDANIALQKVYDNYYDGHISEREWVAQLKPLEEIVKNEKGFNLIFEQYTYVREDSDSRNFLYTNGWDGLLSNDSLDLLLFILLLVLVTPVFCYEFESKMDPLILTVKKGTRAHAVSKVVLVLLTVTLICLLTSGLKYGFYQLKYGLGSGSYPLQSLAYFGASAKDITLFSTFLWVTAIKVFGYLSFAMLMLFISVCLKKYAVTLFSSTAMILLPYYGFSMESSKYFLPGPLGFMVSTGYFRGSEYVLDPSTEQMIVTFKEISNMTLSILVVITLCISIAMFIVILIRHQNVWSTRKRIHWLRPVSLMLILIISVTSLVGCTTNKNLLNDDIYNYSTRQSFENEDYRFYVDEMDGPQVLFEDKKTGEISNLIRDPMPALSRVENNIFGSGSLVYYMKYDFEKSRGLETLDKFSVIEVDTTTFDERIIFEKNINTERDSFLGLNQVDDADALSFFAVGSFFLDKQSIYFIDSDQIRRVNRLTGKSNVIISAPLLTSVAFDGQNIYYLTEQYEVAKYDTELDEETIIPDIITTYFILTDTELLFLNRKDEKKIYAMDLKDFTIQKITDKSVLFFTADDQYIFYEDEASLEKYRIGRDGKNDTLISE